MSNDTLSALIAEPQATELVDIKSRTWQRMSRSGVASATVKLGKGERSMIRFRRAGLEAWFRAGYPIFEQSTKGKKK